VRTSHIALFSLPAVPMILGFDPRYQFVHEDDVVHALEHAARHGLPGVYNVAGDGVLALTEVAGLLGKPYAPILPPWGTGLAAAALRRVGVRIPPEALAQLRFGRGVDNRRFKAAGFRYQYTTREAVIKLGEHLRLHPVVRGAREPYRYEREVEEFLRWSPHVKTAREKTPRGAQANGGEPDRVAAAEQRAAAAERAAQRALEQAEAAERRAAEAAKRAATESARATGSPVDHYDDLAAEEVIAMLGSLERPDLKTLRDYERQNANRARVLSAIDAVISRGETPV
jgi:UDP-glucose 4-epimerase